MERDPTAASEMFKPALRARYIAVNAASSNVSSAKEIARAKVAHAFRRKLSSTAISMFALYYGLK
jgi:hypothetical protein